MTTVFLSGSRKISRINQAIRERLDNMVANKLSIIVGDANGADKAMQGYLAELAYSDVTVFCAGDRCRNNVGEWQTQAVSVSKELKGRDFYAQKDKEMAKLADFGLVLWDGKSAGSITNVLELLKLGKKVVVYYAPEKAFHTVSDIEAAQRLLGKCDQDTFSSISRKVQIGSTLREISQNMQGTLAL